MRISVKVKTNAKVNKIEPSPEKGWVVYVKEPAKEGKANEAVVRVVAEYFKVPKSRVNIKSGLKSRKKVIEIYTFTNRDRIV